MIVYAVVRPTRSHTQFYADLFKTRESAQAVCDQLNAGLRAGMINYTVAAMNVSD